MAVLTFVHLLFVGPALSQADTASLVLAESLAGYEYNYGTYPKTNKRVVAACTDSGLVINNRLRLRLVSGDRCEFMATDGCDQFRVKASSCYEFPLLCRDGAVVKPNYIISIEHIGYTDAIIREMIYWCRVLK